MVKVFVTDMDGTFLRKDHSYDKAKFALMMTKLRAQNKHFVVASGNQWRHIRSFFKGFEHEISIVGENGAVVLHHDTVISTIHFSNTTLQRLLDYLKTCEVVYLSSGVQHSYLLDSYSLAVKDFIALYAQNTVYVSEHRITDDPILKIALMCAPHDTQSLMDNILLHCDDVSVHSSGPGSIDINPLGVHKAQGLSQLLQCLHVPMQHCMAFGDGGNDVTMLQHVGYPKVVANAPLWMHALGDVIPSNENQGVLATILEELERYE